MKGKKTGGRQKGTPNKNTTKFRAIISEMLDDYYDSGKFMDDLMQLKPSERVAIVEKFTGYVVAKLQSTTLDATVNDNKSIIEERLKELSSINDK